MVRYPTAKFVRKQFNNKGFKPRALGHTTRHGVFVLTDLEGNDTKVKTSLFKPHAGTKGLINHWKLKQLSSQLNLYDTEFLLEYIDCTKNHEELLKKLGLLIE